MAFAISGRLLAQELSDPATLDCTTLAAESASLKADLKANGSRTTKSARWQVTTQNVTAVAGLAGQAAAPYIGTIGAVISDVALVAQRAQVNHGLADAKKNLARITALSRRVQALEAERARRCPKERAE